MAEDVQLPDTKQFRIVIGGAIYDAPKIDYDLEGKARVIYTRQFGTRGEVIDLVAREAKRLEDLEAVRPAEEPKRYDEMGEDELRELVDARRLSVRSSGADADLPLREDYINALITYDAGGAVAGASTGPGGVVVTGGGGGERRVDELTGEPRPGGAIEGRVGESAEPVIGGTADAPRGVTEAQLAQRISDEGLNASDTVALAEGDPAKAARVLEAERIAQGGDARQTVEKQLSKLIRGE